MKKVSTTTKKLSVLLIIFSLITVSCNKQSESQYKPADPVNTFKSVREILRTVNRDKLEAFIAKLKSGNNSRLIDQIPVLPDDPLTEAQAQAIVQPINNATWQYLQQKYPQLGPGTDVNVNDPDFTYFAQVYSIAEQSGFIAPIGTEPLTNLGIPAWLRCTVDIIMGYFDVRGLISELGTFEFHTVWVAVKGAIKKYVGFIAAAILIYDITTTCIL